MTDLAKLYRAGLVRRWHTNPDMCGVVDPVEAHAGRVARLCAWLWQDASADLLRAALSHDDGEWAVGDMSARVKRAHPEIAEVLAVMEQDARESIWGPDPVLSEVDRTRLKYADALDAYMTAARYAPAVLGGDGWPEQRAWLIGGAHVLGVAHLVEPAL
jgi:5'-deoxynucleotidase YfbR-like HD superfamily hydrolase